MKRKITLSTLDELSGAISHDEMVNYLGGGSGMSYRDPYTFSEYMFQGWAFTHGWVKLPDGNISYLTENYFSYCGNSTYCFSGYDGSTNNVGNDWYNNSWGYHGSSASPYDSAYVKISELVNQLPEKLRTQLFNVGFEYDSSMESCGQYRPGSNNIYLRVLDYNTLFRECVHAIQANKGYCGSNQAAIEFQEHVIGDVEAIMHSKSGYTMSTVFGNYPSNYETWIVSCIDENKGLNMSRFLAGINNYVLDFQRSHPDTKGYQGTICENYEYDWAEMFRAMGIPIY